ncbi:hypothetical protein HDV06_006524 [Boothiomyces sp. JEL0866]|nr:hypothetical protein HDV06_006524 [Boothiomyces sp. JEL0866]
MISATSSKPINPYSRTKSTLTSEDPDIQQRQMATQQWKLDIEKQINEKKRREREEQQRNELEERMASVKLQRQLFHQDMAQVHLKPTNTEQPKELPKYPSSQPASVNIYSRIPRAIKKEIKEATIANLEKEATDKQEKLEKPDKLDKLPELTIKDTPIQPPAKLVEQKSSSSLTSINAKKTPIGMKRKTIDVKSKVKPIEDPKEVTPPPKQPPLPTKHKVLPSIQKQVEDLPAIQESFDETPEEPRQRTPDPKPVLNPKKIVHTAKPYQRINKNAVGEMEKLKEENLEHLQNMKQLLQEKATELKELK